MLNFASMYAEQFQKAIVYAQDPEVCPTNNAFGVINQWKITIL
jgi:hypothetical protein